MQLEPPKSGVYGVLKPVHPDGLGNLIKWPFLAALITGGTWGGLRLLDRLPRISAFGRIKVLRQLTSQQQLLASLLGVSVPLLGAERITSEVVRGQELRAAHALATDPSRQDPLPAVVTQDEQAAKDVRIEQLERQRAAAEEQNQRLCTRIREMQAELEGERNRWAERLSQLMSEPPSREQPNSATGRNEASFSTSPEVVPSPEIPTQSPPPVGLVPSVPEPSFESPPLPPDPPVNDTQILSDGPPPLRSETAEAQQPSRSDAVVPSADELRRQLGVPPPVVDEGQDLTASTLLSESTYFADLDVLDPNRQSNSVADDERLRQEAGARGAAAARLLSASNPDQQAMVALMSQFQPFIDDSTKEDPYEWRGTRPKEPTPLLAFDLQEPEERRRFKASEAWAAYEQAKFHYDIQCTRHDRDVIKHQVYGEMKYYHDRFYALLRKADELIRGRMQMGLNDSFLEENRPVDFLREAAEEMHIELTRDDEDHIRELMLFLKRPNEVYDSRIQAQKKT